MDAGRLWTGGAATALVAALVAVVGVLIARGLFEVPVLAPTEEGTLGNASTPPAGRLRGPGRPAGHRAAAPAAAEHPQPRRFFSWIITLATIAAALVPFLTGADLDEKVATSAITAAVGLAIGSLLSGVARSAVRPGR